MKIIRNPNQVDKKAIENFISNHPHGNIFQSAEMNHVYKRTKKYNSLFLIVQDKSQRILGLLVAVIQKEHSGLMGRLSARSIIHGGPLIRDNDPEILRLLLKEYDKTVKRGVIYSQFRNHWEWGNLKSIFKECGFVYQDHLNIYIDLTKSVDQLWKEVNSKRRNEIRRAKREGTKFSIKKNESDLKKCYEILLEVYERAKLPLPGYDFFRNLYTLNTNNSNNKLEIFCAEYKGEIIGCMLALVYENVIYDFFAGSRKEFYKKYPNDLIPWEVFKWAKENNYKIFDFGGAGKPNTPYGVRDYKKKFGGKFVNFGRFEKIHKPAMYQLGKIGLNLYQIIK